MSVQPHYYCPQCGYDLSGQKVERCPECNFHYDVPALRTLLAKAFNEACDPYIGGAKFLAAAGVLAVAALIRTHIIVDVALALLFLLSPMLVQSWIIPSGARIRFAIEAFDPTDVRIYGGIGSLFVIVVVMHLQLAVYLIGGALFIGLVWTLLSLLRHRDMIRNNQVLSLPPELRTILERARATAWFLVFVDMGLLAILASQL